MMAPLSLLYNLVIGCRGVVDTPLITSYYKVWRAGTTPSHGTPRVTEGPSGHGPMTSRESGRGPQTNMTEDNTTLSTVAREELAATLAIVGDEIREPLYNLHRDAYDAESVSMEDIEDAREAIKEAMALLDSLERVAQ